MLSRELNYDYERYITILTDFLQSMWRDADELEIGEDISDEPELKIIFDGYGDLETDDDYIEGGNKNMESYAIFIHKNSGQEGFRFPEHDFTPWGLVHRSSEEICIYAWYDVEQDHWEILSLEERMEDDSCMTETELMDILETIHKRYYQFDL
jgi:hypothetical protein